MRNALLLIAAAPLLAACATTSYGPESATAPRAAYAEIHGDVQRMNFAKHVQLALPAKILVVDTVNGQVQGPGERISRLVGALSEDTETYNDVVSLGTDLIARDWADGQLIERLREHASQHQADLLVIAERNETVVEDTNALAPLNILLLPLLFLPTQSDDVDVALHATVYDVRNGVAYTTFDAHREAHVSASVLAEDGAVRSAKDKLFGECADELKTSLGAKLRGIEKKRLTSN